MEDLGRPDDAAAAYQKGLAYRRPLVNPATGNVRFRKGLNEQLQDLHRLWIKMGRPAQRWRSPESAKPSGLTTPPSR